jgi:hypothetical protein
VTFKRKITTVSAKVLAYETQALDERAVFGQVKDGSLVLEASCLRGTQANGPSSFWYQILDQGNGLILDETKVYYILLGYNLEEGAVELILRRRDDGKYLRTDMVRSESRCKGMVQKLCDYRDIQDRMKCE